MLSPEQHSLAHKNEYDFDSPSSIDFDILLERLKDLKAGYVISHSSRTTYGSQNKTSSRNPNLFIRESSAPKGNHIDLLSPCTYSRGYLRLVRSTGSGPTGYENLRRCRCRCVPCTKKYVLCPQSYNVYPADTGSKQVMRDVRERGRDIEGCIKQWMSFVKPNFERYVEPQRKVAGEYCCKHFDIGGLSKLLQT